jgi:hypothetical protein
MVCAAFIRDQSRRVKPPCRDNSGNAVFDKAGGGRLTSQPALGLNGHRRLDAKKGDAQLTLRHEVFE